ncbi:MAG: GAF domain-containing SpoIIE family protein phosphatase [Verrucomicrobiota bacterium]
MPVEPQRLEQLLEVYKGLVEVSALINGITKSSELLPAILDVARRVIKVEAASLFLVLPDGDLELTNASGGGVPFSENGRKIVVPRGRGISGWVLEHGMPLLIADAYQDPRFYPEVDRQTGFRTRSILCAPLTRNGKEIGVLQLLNPIGRACFDQADLEAFSAYGTLAATAIDKLRTVERQIAQDRVDREFLLAREIQTSFLPHSLPQMADVQFAAAYRPALNVGGDFYDVIELGPDEIYFVIGDVSGKGVPAALLMAQAQSMLRLILHPGISPVTAVARWNTMLSSQTIRGMFITAILGRIIPSTHDVEFCNAGHCHPFLINARGECQELKITTSPPLGIVPELPGRSHSLTLAREEWMVLFTDGLVESLNAQNQPLGTKGAAGLVAGKFAQADKVVDALRCGELQHREQFPPHDDLTLLVFGFK